jgi:hypothetical protein
MGRLLCAGDTGLTINASPGQEVFGSFFQKRTELLFEKRSKNFHPFYCGAQP